MTKNDLGSIAAIVAVVGVVSFFVVNFVMEQFVQSDQSVVTAEKISPDIEQPSSQIYNSSALNPAVEIKI